MACWGRTRFGSGCGWRFHRLRFGERSSSFFDLMKTLHLLIALCFAAPLTAAPRNILLVITDNQNWFDLGCYGNKVIHTPLTATSSRTPESVVSKGCFAR